VSAAPRPRAHARRYYNAPSSDYYQLANKLQACVDQCLAATVVEASPAAAGAAAAAAGAP
jgi:hypothetical protein